MVTSYVVTEHPRRDADRHVATLATLGMRGPSLTFRPGGVVIVRRPDGTAVRFEPPSFQRS
jgi:hypothetical protein